MTTDLRWGLSTLGCPERNLPDAVKLANSNGFEFLELRTIGGSNEVFRTLYLPENIDCARQITAAGRCRVLDSAFHIALRSEEERTELLKIAKTADDFGIPYIRVFGHFPILPELTDGILQTCTDNLTWFRDQHFKTQLALETHDSFLSIQRILALQRAYGARLPVIWDAHNTNRFTGMGLEESFEFLGDSIIEVHFKDSHFEGPDRKYVGDLPGHGEMPLKSLFTLLDKKKVTYPVIFEYEKFWQPDLPPIEQALDALKELIRVWKGEKQDAPS